MNAMIRKGWMREFERDGRRFVKPTNEGYGAHLHVLARHYGYYAKRWDQRNPKPQPKSEEGE